GSGRRHAELRLGGREEAQGLRRRATARPLHHRLALGAGAVLGEAVPHRGGDRLAAHHGAHGRGLLGRAGEGAERALGDRRGRERAILVDYQEAEAVVTVARLVAVAPSNTNITKSITNSTKANTRRFCVFRAASRGIRV